MNRRFFVHVVSVDREKSTKTDRKKDRGFDEVFSSVSCLMEPAPTKETNSEIGRLSQAEWVMSLGTEAIMVGDVVRWAGFAYLVSRIRNDSFRPFSSVAPYQVAELTARP